MKINFFKLLTMQKQVFRVTNVKIFNLKQLFLIVLVLVLIYTPFKMYINKKDKILINSDDNNNNKLKIPIGKDGCKIIDINHKQYTVILDGVTYPQYLYLSQNKSINYDCLSKSTPVKKIFSWKKNTKVPNSPLGPVTSSDRD